MDFEQQELEKYVDLYQQVRSTVTDAAAAAEIVNQIGKESRMHRMMNGRSPGRSVSSGGDQPASERQLGYLQSLGIKVESGLTKQQASALIDEAQK